MEVTINPNNKENGQPKLHTQKQWSRLKANDSWMMFKVMAELVDGFERLNRIGPCVSVFGSARTKPGHKYYELAVEISKRLTEEGFGIITGGGPGIMEAANKGAAMGGGVSVGLNIDIPHEQHYNQYITPDMNLSHRYFFIRKVMFVRYAQAFVALPGGFGTMDELFEVITLIQTKKITKVPVILVGTDFWGGLKDWLHSVMCLQESNIYPEDLELLPITDDPAEVIRTINEFYEQKSAELTPNYEL